MRVHCTLQQCYTALNSYIYHTQLSAVERQLFERDYHPYGMVLSLSFVLCFPLDIVSALSLLFHLLAACSHN